MPPKPKYTKDQIVTAAYEIAKEKGIDAVVAREVGKKLNTSASPIFSVFENMEELKDAVYRKALGECIEYLKGAFEYVPAGKEYGLRWVKYAIANKNFYRMLFLPARANDDLREINEMLTREFMNTFKLSYEDAKELTGTMVIHANGIASYATGGKTFTDEEILKSISEVCVGVVLAMKIKAGEVDWKMAETMIASIGSPAVKK